MSKATTMSVIGDVLLELIATPNGQLRLIGGIMCIGPAYYIATGDVKATMFTYAMLGVGFALIMVSAAMAVIAAKHEAASVVDERREDRSDFPPSERLQAFAKDVLSVPRTKQELSECDFGMYQGMLKNDLYGLLMQATAKECVLSGIAKFQGGRYMNRDTTEQTVMVQR